MIELRNVCKVQRTGGTEVSLLSNIDFEIANDARLVIFAKNDPSRTALINVMSGLEQPDAGEVARIGRVSFPIGRNLPVDPETSGAEICRYYARLHGAHPPTVEANCYDVSELGALFFRPFKGYSSGERARLKMSLALALNFTIHLVEEGIPTGKRAGQPAVARLFEQRLEQTAVVLFTDNPANPFMRRFCESAAVLSHGRLVAYNNFQVAKAQFRNGS